jgi:hypothetical protein
MHATHCHEETNQLAVSQENVKQQQVNVVGETAFPRRNTRWAHIVGGGHRPISFMLFLLCFKFIEVYCINLESFVRSGEEDGLCTHSTACTKYLPQWIYCYARIISLAGLGTCQLRTI